MLLPGSWIRNTCKLLRSLQNRNETSDAPSIFKFGLVRQKCVGAQKNSRDKVPSALTLLKILYPPLMLMDSILGPQPSRRVYKISALDPFDN